MDRLLLLHENEDLRDLLAAELQAALKGGVACVGVASCEAALQAMAAEPFRFGVWGAGAPATDLQEADNLGHAALKEKLEALAAGCPSFLVLATVDDEELRQRVKAQPGGALAPIGPDTDWLETAKRYARAAFGLDETSADLRRTQAVLQIVVRNESQGQWRIERRGRLQGTHEGTLTFGQGVLEDMCMRSEALFDQLKTGDWGRCLLPLGRDVYRLFNDSAQGQLGAAFTEMVDEVGGLDKVRVVFGLPSEHYVLPVETIKDLQRATQADHWYALKAAILRHYEGAGPLEPLFWDSESRRAPVDCLLVAADPREGVGYDALPQAEYEVDEIARVLRQQKTAGANVGEVEVLKLREHEPAESALGEALARREWKLVHFAGHADIRPGEGDRPAAGELALSPANGELMDFAAAVRVLPRAQFLFVSSCRSANPVFLQEAIRQSVPAVLGYRWPVIDADACDLAAAFYEALFAPGGPAYRSLGRALSVARTKVFTKYPSHFTWSSPVLLAKGSARMRSDALAVPAAAAEAGATP